MDFCSFLVTVTSGYVEHSQVPLLNAGHIEAVVHLYHTIIVTLCNYYQCHFLARDTPYIQKYIDVYSVCVC